MAHPVLGLFKLVVWSCPPTMTRYWWGLVVRAGRHSQRACVACHGNKTLARWG